MFKLFHEEHTEKTVLVSELEQCMYGSEAEEGGPFQQACPVMSRLAW